MIVNFGRGQRRFISHLGNRTGDRSAPSPRWPVAEHYELFTTFTRFNKASLRATDKRRARGTQPF